MSRKGRSFWREGEGDLTPHLNGDRQNLAVQEIEADLAESVVPSYIRCLKVDPERAVRAGTGFVPVWAQEVDGRRKLDQQRKCEVNEDDLCAGVEGAPHGIHHPLSTASIKK
jgi:hypothetical protein